MFQDIRTVTLNPALDVTIWVDALDDAEPVRANREQTYPGGKAVNVARVLTELRVPCKVLGICGADGLAKMRRLLAVEGVEAYFQEVSGPVRENLSIVCNANHLYKIDRLGFSVSELEFESFLQYSISELADLSNPLTVFSGSLPKGLKKADYFRFINCIRQTGMAAAIDTDLFTEQELRALHPLVIKPNRQELNHIAGRQFLSVADAAKYACLLSQDIEYVLVSLGADGLLCAFHGECWHAVAPCVEVASTVGAGDTTLAGFLAALHQEDSLPEAIRYACACGVAAVQTEGTTCINRDAPGHILKLIQVKPVNTGR